MNITELANILTGVMGCVCGREAVFLENRRFFVKTRLGEGGFSYVDLVEDARTRKLFALKRIACHAREDEKIAQNEVDYMNMVSHSNLVPCEGHALIKLRGGARTAISEMFIVMPYYRKGGLNDELDFLRKKGDFMKEKKVLTLFIGICEGVRALHNNSPTRLAHRDIKPHNVMLSDDDTPVLMDFGSMGPARNEINGPSEALKLQDLAAERCSMPYRPPELFNVESRCSIDERTDIWSLGCTLYAMCFYESPFDAIYQRGDSIALAVLGGNIKFPENSPYSDGIKDLIQSMMKVSMTERPFIDAVYESADYLLNAQLNRV